MRIRLVSRSAVCRWQTRPVEDRSQAVVDPRKILSVTREWPWGLALVTDPGSSEPVPTELDANGVAAGRSVVAASIRHAVDGSALAEVWIGSPSEQLQCAYEGEFITVCGAVIVGDAAYERHDPVEIGEGSHRLRILMSEIGSPDRVVFAFSR